MESRSGEASVLALAQEHGAHLVIIDEKKAREEAKRIGLPVRGTVGVLLEAKQKGLIDTIEPLLEVLRDNGMYLDQSFIDDVLQTCREKRSDVHCYHFTNSNDLCQFTSRSARISVSQQYKNNLSC